MSKARRRELLLRVIDLCQAVEEKGLDPFKVDVPQMFERMRPLLNQGTSWEEACLDIEAVLGLAGVIFQQGDWIRHRSSLLYMDPLLVMVRLQNLSKNDLAEILMRSWHPIISQESLSPGGIEEAVRYWENLVPLKERGLDFETGELPGPTETSRDDLFTKGMISSQSFIEKLEDHWRKLREEAGEAEGISYWKFIDAETYEETVKRAYLTSFLVSYGYASLEVDPLEERITIRPKSKPREPFKDRGGGFSIPISIPRDRWKREHPSG